MTYWKTWNLLNFCRSFCLAAAALLLVIAEAQAESALSGRLIVGYQGWFGCPNDFSGNKEWRHWFTGPVGAESITVDVLPSLSEFRSEDLCDTGLKRQDGSAVHVFSSQNPNVVDKHFEWLKDNGIDGVALQRFVANTRKPIMIKRSDNVLAHVRRSAERHNRVFYITYDISGADPLTMVDDIRNDWKYLTAELNVTKSAAYLKQDGKPVVQIWGLGFKDRPGTAEEAELLISDLKNGRAGITPTLVVGGVPTGWRTLTGDSKSEPSWAKVYRSYDVISPWTVGRFSDEAGADNFRRVYIEPDVAETRRLGRGYMPVVFPGFSWHNLMTKRGQFDKAILNQIPRRCGKFMWRQVFNALEVGADSVYAAMFDEVDEGTALFKVENRAPIGVKLVSTSDDGCLRPEDWYLKVTGRAAQLLRNHQAPTRVLEHVLRRP